MQKRIVTVQDISCVGQCSLTVALPIISAYGVEAAILPSAVLSTHTGGFKGQFTFRDLTDDFQAIIDHWAVNELRFDALYTGYIGNVKQFTLINEIKNRLMAQNAPIVIDPVMGDNGRLYTGFDAAFVKEMTRFISGADFVLPNITEASAMLGTEYKSEYDEDYIRELCEGMVKLGAKNVVITGVSFAPEKIGAAVYSGSADGNGKLEFCFEDKVNVNMHGTGDVFASSFLGGLMNGLTPLEAASGAAKFTRNAILNTMDSPEHFYGVNFEGVLRTVNTDNR